MPRSAETAAASINFRKFPLPITRIDRARSVGRESVRFRHPWLVTGASGSRGEDPRRNEASWLPTPAPMQRARPVAASEIGCHEHPWDGTLRPQAGAVVGMVMLLWPRRGVEHVLRDGGEDTPSRWQLSLPG